MGDTIEPSGKAKCPAKVEPACEHVADGVKPPHASRPDTASQASLEILETHSAQSWRWAASSRETTNFTYPITQRNRLHLAHFTAVVTGRPVQEIESYFAEIETDEHARQHVIYGLREGPWAAISDPRFDPGRRIVWYAIARALKPEVIVESDCERGFGAVCLVSAIIRNGTGRYYGLDISRKAGWLVRGRFAERAEVIYGDAIKSLKAFDRPIDLFVSDGNHKPEYEAAEYETVAGKMAPGAVIIGDNSHGTNALEAFARKTGRRFLYITDEPIHWSPQSSVAVVW